MTFTMSEPMDFTSPTHGHIYARTSRVLSILEPGIQSQLLYPVNPNIPPQISNSVPPYLYSANRRLQPLLSPSIISPTLSLPHILSTTPDNILHHQSLMPSAYRRLNNPHFHQPTPHGSPGLRPPPIASPIENFYPPQYAPAAMPDAMNPPLQTHSQAHSHQTLRLPSSVMESHHSHPNSLFRQTPPHMNNYHHPHQENILPNNYPISPLCCFAFCSPPIRSSWF